MYVLTWLKEWQEEKATYSSDSQDWKRRVSSSLLCAQVFGFYAHFRKEQLAQKLRIFFKSELSFSCCSCMLYMSCTYLEKGSYSLYLFVSFSFEVTSLTHFPSCSFWNLFKMIESTDTVLHTVSLSKELIGRQHAGKLNYWKHRFGPKDYSCAVFFNSGLS